MNIGSLFKALVSIAKSDAASTLLPAIAKAAGSVATNQGSANLIANGAQLQVTALALGPKVAQDELQTLADVVNLEAQALVSSGAAAVTPASAAAAAIAG